MDVDEKDNAKLSCRVVKFVSNKVDWSFNDSAVQLGPRMRVVNSTTNGSVYNTLHIKNVSTSDSGRYKCYGEFTGVSSEAEIILNVRGNAYLIRKICISLGLYVKIRVFWHTKCLSVLCYIEMEKENRLIPKHIQAQYWTACIATSYPRSFQRQEYLKVPATEVEKLFG